MASTSSKPDTGNFFDDDDEETQRSLLENAAEASLQPRLESLSKRFLEDHQNPAHDDQWKRLVDSVKNDGFALDTSSKGAAPTGGSSTSRPSAFDSEDGKKHLHATQSILGLSSEQRAIQLTLSAVSDLNDSKNFQSLLGTRSLFETVMKYHYRQRIARVSTIAELIRQDQDESGADNNSIGRLLETLDSCCIINGEKRGLFKVLLSIACRKVGQGSTTKRDQLTSAMDLKEGTPTSLAESLKNPSGDKAWYQFVSKFLHETRSEYHQEQIQAMEGLVALLYSRVGVRRVDYMLLLKAFLSTDAFFTANDHGEKLPKLAGLVCAECMGLWRVFDENPTDMAWVLSHPLLSDILGVSTSQTEKELEALRVFLFSCPDQMKAGIRNAPESLAFLSFGLLLMLTYDAILPSAHGADALASWQAFREHGQELVMFGQNLAAFDFFHATMISLVEDPSPGCSDRQVSDLPYNWLLPGGAKLTPMEICDGTESAGMEMEAKSLLSASIGHEILVSLIVAFSDTIFSPEHNSRQENLSMICDLSSNIYRNQPSLCLQFWSDWDAYTSSNPPPTTPPLVQIVDLAFSLNSSRDELGKDDALSTLSLQMQLLSTLCFSADNCEFAFGTLPPDALQTSLLSLSDAHGYSVKTFGQNSFRFLNSLCHLTRVGDSISCRNMIRLAIGAPHIILNVASSTTDARSKECTMEIAANLLQDAPVEWTVAFARGMQTLLSPNSFEENEGTGFARIFHALSLSLPAVISSEEFSNLEAEYLDMIWRGILFLAPLLPRCLSSMLVARDSASLKTVKVTMDFFSSVLENIAPLALIHEPAGRLRSAMVELMSSHIGESVMFYALLPVSLCIGFEIDSWAEEKNLHNSANMQESGLSGKYGLWHATATGGSSSSAESNAGLTDIMLNTSPSFELASAKSGEDLNHLISLVCGSLALIRLWAINVQDCIATTSCLSYEQKERLSSLSPQRILSQAAAIPKQWRSKGSVRAYWESISPSNFMLLTQYIEGKDWPLPVTSLTIDVLHACVLQMKLAGMKENLKDLIQRSTVFNLVASLTGGGPTHTNVTLEEKRGTRILSCLSLRFAAATQEALPTDDTTNALVTKLIKSAFNGTKRACNKLYEFRETKQKLGLENESLLDDILYGVSCLCFLRAVWGDASRLEGSFKISEPYDDKNGVFLPTLTKVLLQHAYMESIDSSASGFVQSFVASVADFMRLAVSEQVRRDQATGTLMMEMLQDSLKLISMPKNFMTIDAMSPPNGNALLGAAPHSLFHSFPIFAACNENFEFFNTDVTAAAQRDNKARTDDLHAVALSSYGLSSQVALSMQWRKLALVLLQTTSHNDSQSNQFLLACQEVLRCFYDNLTRIELVATHGSSPSLRPQDLTEIAQSTVSLVLVLLSSSSLCTSAQTNENGVAVEILGLISGCASKVFNILEPNVSACFQVEHHLLTAAIGVLMSLSGHVQSSSPLKDAVDQLVSTTGRLLQLIEVESAGSSDCLKTCIVMLTMLTAEDGFEIALAQRLRDLRLMDTLVKRVGLYTQPDKHHMSIGEEGDEADRVGMAVLESFVDMLLACESLEMLELVYHSGALTLLTRNVYLERASKVWSLPPASPTSFRGYTSTRVGRSPASRMVSENKEFFKQDPCHRLWTKTLRCYGALCRATRQHIPQSPVTSFRDFIVTHSRMMFTCLENVETSMFTKNSLKEATSILALLTEFCARPCRDSGTLQLVGDVFVPISLKLVARLCSFLGASAAAREHADSDDASSGAMMGTRMSPFNRVHNARHEAIRYSHYASRFLQKLTSEDFSENSIAQNKSLDEKDLEKVGKAMMSSKFQRSMEILASECLLSAVSLLWETHPANACFVMLSQNNIDAMPLVKPGMVIGFHSHRESQRVWSFGVSYSHFAEVMHCDTLDRAWYVHDLETGKGEKVQASQIIGIEEPAQRRCLLRYEPAPDSATGLESDAQSVSIGHVILGLRWCTVISNPPPAVRRLTGLLSALVGAELSMHKTIRSSESKEPELIERLFAQLLDLYGDVCEPEGAALPGGTLGRCKSMLDEKSWISIQLQLQEELKAADEARENDRMVIEDDGLLLRSSSGRNPFNDLRLNF